MADRGDAAPGHAEGGHPTATGPAGGTMGLGTVLLLRRSARARGSLPMPAMRRSRGRGPRRRAVSEPDVVGDQGRPAAPTVIDAAVVESWPARRADSGNAVILAL